MTSSHRRPVPCQWFSWLAAVLDRRTAPRLALLFLGAVLARGRRTVTSGIRAAKLADEFPSCDTAVAAAGKETGRIAARLVIPVVRRLVAGASRFTCEAEELVDRSGSPWASPSRRPSHADKRRAWRRALLGEEIHAVLRPGVTEAEIQAAADRLLSHGQRTPNRLK